MGLRMAADEWLTHDEEQATIFPIEAHGFNGVATGERGNARGHVENRGHPSGASSTGGDEHAAGRLLFREFVPADAVTRGNMRLRAEEQIIEGQQALAVV